jgi:two-component system, chemotaxis family, chemotaxis protein CheY
MKTCLVVDDSSVIRKVYEFLRALRRLPGGDGPKVVFCTTENDVAHIARALHAGANEYIMKPFDKDIVEAKFQEVGLL